MSELKPTTEESIRHFETQQKRYVREHNGKLCPHYANAIEALRRAQPADVARVVHGRWILLGKNEHDYETSVEEKCSLCGRYVYRYDTELQDNYCPNCGARMDKEDET